MLLKGPTLQFAWGDTLRPYVDLDLLVSPHDHARARSVLQAAGFVPRTDLTPGHATTLQRAGDANVDLHWTLIASNVSPAQTWSVLRAEVTGPGDDGLLRLSPSAATCVAVLHAWWTPADVGKPAEDVRAIVEVEAPLIEARQLAERLRARRAFDIGLCAVAPGRAAAIQLGIRPPSRVEVTASRVMAKTKLALDALRRSGWSGLKQYLWPSSGPGALSPAGRRQRIRRALRRLFELRD